jgi:hypothetical protein
LSVGDVLFAVTEAGLTLKAGMAEAERLAP